MISRDYMIYRDQVISRDQVIYRDSLPLRPLGRIRARRRAANHVPRSSRATRSGPAEPTAG
jgi:hypothetical protein